VASCCEISVLSSATQITEFNLVKFSRFFLAINEQYVMVPFSYQYDSILSTYIVHSVEAEGTNVGTYSRNCVAVETSAINNSDSQ
jgi:hypothetical protein